MRASRSGWVLTALAGALFVLLALLLVPWDPVPGGPIRPVAAEEIFTPAEIERAEHYSSRVRLWSYSSLAVSLLVISWFAFSRVSRRMVARLRGPWWIRVLLAVVGILVSARVITLPFAVQLRRLRLDEGLTTQAWSGFWIDLVKSEVVEILVMAGVVLVVVGTARRFSTAWPWVAGTVLAGLVVLGSFVYPVAIEPLFNEFESLQDGELRRAVMRLAEDEGVRVDDVLVADASRRTTTLNAWVSGYGSTRRVVLYDNLVADLPQDQVLSVVAHELAHAQHGDVVVGTALGAAGTLASAGLLCLALGSSVNRGRTGVGDPVVVPLVLGLLMIGMQLAAPLENGVSRRLETRADVTALRATRDAPAFERLQHQLATRSLADPTPPAWSQWLWGSHPGTLTRVALARRLATEGAD